jgi:hypothetical protein
MQPRIIGTLAVPLAAAFLCVTGAPAALAQRESVTIPENTIAKVRLDQSVSSRTARVGDRVVALVTADDRSGFPESTRLEGTVTEVQRSSDSRPGIIDMDFTRAVLPGGQSLTIRGQLASLAEEDVRQADDGRIVTRRKGSGEKFEPKWVGYGAAGGAVLATILGESFLRGALLGGLGGAIYGYLNKDKNKGEFREVTLDQGTTFGVRLADRVAFRERGTYRYGFRPGRENGGRVSGSRQTFRYSTPTVRVNGTDVRFTEAEPLLLNGALFVPLRPVAQAAGMTFTHDQGEDNFVLRTASGPIRGIVGEMQIRGRGAGEAETLLEASPISVNGEIYVPVEFLSRIGDMTANWDRQTLRLELEASR